MRFSVTAGRVYVLDGVRICLRYRRTVATEILATLPVAIRDGPMSVRSGSLHPREQRGAEIEADPAVVVYNLGDAAFWSENARCAVGRVTFRQDPLIPIVVGIG